MFEFGSGTYSFSGSFAGESAIFIDGGGVVSFNGATVNLGDTFVAGESGTILHLLGGALNVMSEMDMGVDTRLEQMGGTLGGAGTLSVGGIYQWSGGTQSGSGVTLIEGDADIHFSGPGLKNLSERTLEMTGTALVVGTGNVVLSNGAAIDNSGLLDLQSDAGFTYANDGSAAVRISNLATGILRKSSGTGVSEFGGSTLPFANAGIVDLQSGTVHFAAGFTQTAGTLTLAGGTASSGGPLLLQGGELTGSGSITGNVVNSAGTIRPGGSSAAGTLTVTGNYNQESGGTLAVDLGGTTAGSFDALTVTGSATLSGTLDVAIIGAYTPGAGQQFRVVSSSNNPGAFTALTGQFTELSQSADDTGLLLLVDSTVPAPDLVVTSSNGMTSVTLGSTLTYTIQYRNDGLRRASNVELTEILPAGTSFNAGASTTGWIETAPGSGVFEYLVGALEAASAGGSVTFAVTVDAIAPSGLNSISNSVSISDDGQNGADATPINNSATETDTLDASPDLQVTIEADTTVAKRGGFVAYTVGYANAGNQNASGVFLTQVLPTDTIFDATSSTPGWTETAPGSGVYRFDIGNLTAGTQGSVIFTLQCETSLSAGTTGLIAGVSIGDDAANGADPTPLDNTAGQTIGVYQGVYILAPGVPVRLKDAAPPTVVVFNIATGAEEFRFDAYDSTYRDSVRIAVGDLNGDGFDDIITSKRTGTGEIRVFDGLTGTQFSGPLGQIDPFDGLKRKTRGAFVAAGDVTGDGRDDIIAGSALGGGAVKVFDGVSGALVTSYQPFGAKFKGGVRVATGDVNGDGVDEVIVGQGAGGSRVKVFDGNSDTLLQNFRAGPKGYWGGIFVASGDFDGDGKADILTGRDIGSAPKVETFSGIDNHRISSIMAFNKRFLNGVRVSAADVNLDGIADIIATSGTKNKSQVRIFDGSTGAQALTFAAFPEFPDSSLFVASSTTVPISLSPTLQP